MRKRFLILVGLAVLVTAVGILLLLRTWPIVPDSKVAHHVPAGITREKPTVQPFKPVAQKEQHGKPQPVHDRIQALAESPAEFAKYLGGLKTERLLDLARSFLNPSDKGTLYYGIGSELIRRFRAQEDVRPVLQIVKNIKETAELRRFGFELLRASFSYVDEQSQRQILKAGVQVAFSEPDASSELRQSALICANYAMTALSVEDRSPSDEVDLYCERLNELMMDKREEGVLRGLSIDGLGKLHYSEAEPHLLRLLASEDDRKNTPVARTACLALARLGAYDAVSTIGEVLQDTEDPRIYGSAALSIGRIGGEEALGLLVDNANRFDTGSCGVAIRQQKDKILQILSDVESPYLSEAIRATQYLYHPDEVEATKEKLIKLLPQLTNDEQITSALSRLHQVGTKEECTTIITLVPRKPAYGDAWDAVYRRSIAVSVEGQPSAEPTEG